MSAKQKTVHGRGLSNLNLGIFVCSFDVCRASKPFPSINYGLWDLKLVKWIYKNDIVIIIFLMTIPSVAYQLEFVTSLSLL